MMQAPHLRVLVVEDEALIRWSIAETLAEHGHSVVEAGSAATAVQALHDLPQPIDVVLLDLRLPDSSNLDLLASIRRLRPESAVVMMTAYDSPEVARHALELGAYRVLDKPFDLHALEHLLIEAHSARNHAASGTSPH
ncbi:MAG: response regulator [Acidobacteria bacterium]|nr:response regulator [Acidobacteriota bacterium]